MIAKTVRFLWYGFMQMRCINHISGIQLIHFCKFVNTSALLYECFVPQFIVNEGLQHLTAAFHEKRLYALFVEGIEHGRNTVVLLPMGGQIVDVLRGKYNGLRLWSHPFAHGERRMVCYICVMTNENGLMLSTATVANHLSEWCADAQLTGGKSYHSFARLRPFQRDERSLLTVISKEMAVKTLTFLLKYAYRHFYSCLANTTDAASLHLGKRIDGADNAASHAFLYNKLSTGRRLAVMCTGFKTDIDSGLRKQMLIFL